MNLTQRFDALAYWIAEKAGAWQHTAFWLVAVLCWLAIGPTMHWSNTWQLLSNTPTTIAELFLGLAILVDGARQIVMLRAMLAHMNTQLDHQDRLERHILALQQAIAARAGIQDTEEPT